MMVVQFQGQCVTPISILMCVCKKYENVQNRKALRCVISIVTASSSTLVVRLHSKVKPHFVDYLICVRSKSPFKHGQCIALHNHNPKPTATYFMKKAIKAWATRMLQASNAFIILIIACLMYYNGQYWSHTDSPFRFRTLTGHLQIQSANTLIRTQIDSLERVTSLYIRSNFCAVFPRDTRNSFNMCAHDYVIQTIDQCLLK